MKKMYWIRDLTLNLWLDWVGETHTEYSDGKEGMIYFNHDEALADAKLHKKRTGHKVAVYTDYFARNKEDTDIVMRKRQDAVI